MKLSTLGKQKPGVMYKVFGLRVGPNFAVRPATGKNFYLSLKDKKMVALTIFTEKYLWPYDSNFTAASNYSNLKTEIQSAEAVFQRCS